MAVEIPITLFFGGGRSHVFTMRLQRGSPTLLTNHYPSRPDSIWVEAAPNTEPRGPTRYMQETTMKLSKNTLYLGIIAYCGALLVFQDWGSMAAVAGTASALWLGKMVLDIGFVGIAGVRMAGDSLFADDEADDEVAIHAEDLAVSDTALFGLFMLNVLGNAGFHGYETVMTTGAVSLYFSIWFMAEIVVFLVTYILFSHARKSQARAARKARDLAKAQATQANVASDPQARVRSVA
jgi:hypothetical protein